MLDSVVAILTGLAGTYLLVWLLPTACGLGIGLVIVGFMRGKVSWIVGGAAFPLAVLALGGYLQSAGIANDAAPANLAGSIRAVSEYLGYSLAGAALIFVAAVVPAIVRVARR